ncbi:hypothetical protein ABGT17_22325 [Rossellomorea marisflavi]
MLRNSRLGLGLHSLWDVPFRCGRPLSTGRESSLLSCASGVSIFPLFPLESGALRFIALFGHGASYRSQLNV